MPQTISIPGSAGTLPQGPAPDDRSAPPVDTTPRGRGVAPRRDRAPHKAPTGRGRPVTPARPSRAATELAGAIEVARKYRAHLKKTIPNVLDVRAGYKFRNGRITDTPAVVVVVTGKVKGLPAAQLIPLVLDGIVTDVTPADPFERLRSAPGEEIAAAVRQQPRLLIDELQGTESEEAADVEELAREITYEPPRDGDLSKVTGAMTVTCHVSPDAGWAVLEPFLSATETQICLGMYDFTAPHIYRTARTLLKNEAVTWRQTLGPQASLPKEGDVDSTKADDLTEEKVNRGLRRLAGDRFENAFAHIGTGQTFASAYHIKVAVRDKKSFWLSSGNWQSSNQPDIDFMDQDADVSLIARFNREWHVVIENPSLAKAFQVFLEHDFKAAKAPLEEAAAAAVEGPDLLIPVEEFLREEEAARSIEVFPPRKFVFTQDRPLTVQPILTPDNYTDIVVALLRKRPTKRLYFQNQSLNPIKSPNPEFEELMQLLADYSQDENLDVRLIFRNIGPVRKKLESLKAAGFNMQRVRMQEGCHTKGIIIDSKTVLLGSHNFTNEGVLANRDASLLIHNEDIAQYYERVFLHDWERMSRETLREEAVPIPVGTPGAEAAQLEGEAYVRVPWSFIEED
jgi:PLD-like domain